MVKEINAEEYSEIVNSSNPVVIDFHATWCGPCKVLSPILEELDDEIDGVGLALGLRKPFDPLTTDLFVFCFLDHKTYRFFQPDKLK